MKVMCWQGLMEPLKVFENPRPTIVPLWKSRIKPYLRITIRCYVKVFVMKLWFHKCISTSLFVYVFVLFLNMYPDRGFLKFDLWLIRIKNSSNICFYNVRFSLPDLRFEKKRERGKQKSMYFSYSQDLREVFVISSFLYVLKKKFCLF